MRETAAFPMQISHRYSCDRPRPPEVSQSLKVPDRTTRDQLETDVMTGFNGFT